MSAALIRNAKRRGQNNEELTDLLQQIDPEDYLVWLGVDYQVTRGRSGTQLNVKTCPRCGGSERKVYLNAESGLGNCFHGTCVDEPGFNLFSFTKAMFDDNGKEAVDQIKEYAKTVGWKPAKPKPKAERVQSAEGVQLPASVALPVKGRNLQYLQVRGILAETVETLGWRFCKSGHFDYIAPDGQARKQDYSNRVIIPVFDLKGEVRTFQGRDITGTSDRKYLFPPGLAGTGQFLYNAHNAMGCETLVICEGAFDVAATLQAISADKTQNVGVVGSFGKKLSMSATGEEDQLTQLYALKEAGMRRVIFLWDGELRTVDDAFQEAAQLRRFGFDSYVGQLPLDMDPNEAKPLDVRQAIRQAKQATPMNVNAARMRLRYCRS